MELMMVNQIFSVVIPIYNSEKTLVELTERLTRFFLNISEEYEIILVDDYSVDNSWQILKSIHKKNASVKIIRLQKNFGQHNAILCGLNYVKGDYIIIMDDDLQHPPEEIPKLISKIQEGYLVVYGRYNIKKHGLIENFFSKQFQKFIHRILDIPSTVFISSFAIITSSVVKNMINIKSSYIFLPALVRTSVSTNKIANVEVFHNPRKIGKSNYNILKYLNLSLNLIINYSVLPLSIIGFFGIIISIMSFFYGGYILMRFIFDPNFGLMGWTSTMIVLTFLGGIILFSIAIIGEYLRRILKEVSYGQQYVIEEMKL